MKPSERILEISKELNKKDPMYVMMGGDMFIRSQAILDYLDEEYEKNKPCKCVTKGDTITNANCQVHYK